MAHRDKSTRIVRKLRETGDLYRELFNSINVCVAIYRAQDDGADFTVKDLNTAAETLEKVNRLDVIGSRILEVFPGFKEFGIFEVMQRVWQTGVPEHLPARFYQKDKKTGGWRDSYVYKSPSGDIVVVYEDITERKKGEDALKETEQRYRTVADYTYDWEFWKSPEGKVLYVSPSCERISGYPPGHFIKDRRLMDKLILTEDKEIWNAHIESIKKPIEDRIIFRIRRKDGAVCWIEHFCRPIIDENGSFLGIRGTNRDVTKRILAEKAVEASEKRFMTAFNVNPDPVAITDVETGRIILVNPAYEKWSGYSRSELIGATTKGLNFWVNPGDRDSVTSRLREKGEVSDVEVRLRTKDGTGHEVLFSANFVEMNGIRYMFSRRHDLTERKIMERAVRESEEKYRAVFENTGEAINIATGGRVVFANERTLETLQCSREDLYSRPFLDFVHPDDRNEAKRLYLERLSGHTIDPVWTFRTIVKDGSIRWLEARSTYILWEGQPSVLAFTTDVTARKQAEEALEQVNREQAAIIDFLPDATFAVDNERKVVFWNRAMEKISGIAATDMIGKGDYAYTVPFYGEARPLLMDLIWEDREDVRSRYPNITREGNAFVTEVFCPALYGGKGAWVFAKATPLYDRDGNIVGAIESTRDISAHKHADNMQLQSR